MADLLSRFQGCLLGGAIGDALGMPVETMTHEEIMVLNNGQGVIDFMDPVQRKFKDAAKLPAGATTDDTQLTIIVAESLIHSGGTLDINDCAQRHVEEWRKNHMTWGGSTRSAIAEIAEGKRDPKTPPAVTEKTGLGNGVAMKIAPLGLLASNPHRLDDGNLALFRECCELGYITHGDPRASIAAFAVADTIRFILQKGINQSLYGGIWGCLENTIVRTTLAEDFVGRPRWDKNEVSERLRLILSGIDDPDKLRENVGCGFTSLETAPFTLGTFMRHPTDFRAGILEAVNAGGDADTNAAIVGNLIGANLGIEGIPPTWIKQFPARDEILGVANRLFEISTSN
ncbi:MAG: ADP-ribosylglycohydrolase [Parcubacteria group bacterium Gr01-1014_20]|nr:MAG: ADP-ribosylglycohydrolase [Parcubacteria group bacterium Gr01-1014_20]